MWAKTTTQKLQNRNYKTETTTETTYHKLHSRNYISEITNKILHIRSYIYQKLHIRNYISETTYRKLQNYKTTKQGRGGR